MGTSDFPEYQPLDSISDSRVQSSIAALLEPTDANFDYRINEFRSWQ
jgi:hypothetical protein